MQNAVHANRIHTDVQSPGIFVYKSNKKAALLCEVCSPAFKQADSCSPTPDTPLNTVLHTQSLCRVIFIIALVFFLQAPVVSFLFAGTDH